MKNVATLFRKFLIEKRKASMRRSPTGDLRYYSPFSALGAKGRKSEKGIKPNMDEKQGFQCQFQFFSPLSKFYYKIFQLLTFPPKQES